MGNTQAVCYLANVNPDWPAWRQLSAIGHPGYSETFAQAVLALVLTGYSPAIAIDITYSRKGTY